MLRSVAPHFLFLHDMYYNANSIKFFVYQEHHTLYQIFMNLCVPCTSVMLHKACWCALAEYLKPPFLYTKHYQCIWVGSFFSQKALIFIIAFQNFTKVLRTAYVERNIEKDRRKVG